MVSHFFSTFILSFDYLLNGLIIPLACSKTLKVSIVCIESNRDSWIWYYQDSKMPRSIPYSFNTPGAPCYLHLPDLVHVYFLRFCALQSLPLHLHSPSSSSGARSSRKSYQICLILNLNQFLLACVSKPTITPLEHLSQSAASLTSSVCDIYWTMFLP